MHLDLSLRTNMPVVVDSRCPRGWGFFMDRNDESKCVGQFRMIEEGVTRVTDNESGRHYKHRMNMETRQLFADWVRSHWSEINGQYTLRQLVELYRMRHAERPLSVDGAREITGFMGLKFKPDPQAQLAEPDTTAVSRAWWQGANLVSDIVRDWQEMNGQDFANTYDFERGEASLLKTIEKMVRLHGQALGYTE